MKISLVTPAGPGLRNGNRHTALRWAAFLRAAGHRVEVSTEDISDAADLMLALHARRSYPSIRNFSRKLVVALTGTDIYRDIRISPEARASLEFADRLIVLQPKALDELPARFRRKAHVVVQSSATRLRHSPPKKTFRLCVIGHLRAEKDPLRTLAALAHVPGEVEVVHIGALLDAKLKPTTDDPRYRWLGGLPHARALRWLASSHAMVISSRMEGGANVVCEAMRIGVPVLASRVSGNVGLLGARYRGYFALGDERELARLIIKAREPKFYRGLKEQLARLQPLVDPRREARALLSAVL
jgi:putative glycosyltransferase (TIGR04348 family)